MSSLRIAILDDYQSVALRFADWSRLRAKVAAIDVFTDTLADEDALVERLAPYEIICAMRERTKFRKSLLDRLPRLRLIATTGMRNLGIDAEYAKSKKIVVSGTASNASATLEHIWAIILATVRHVVHEDANMRANKPQWQSHIPGGLSGKTLGLIGLGRLGIQTATIAKAFGMRVVGWSPNFTPERAADAGVEFASSKEELLRQSDVVSLHIVLSERTRHIIKAEDFALMKPTAYFINTSRGPLVDEAALISTLKAKKIAGAGLDVYDIEPLPLDHPIRRLENVTLTPHNAYVNATSYTVNPILAPIWLDAQQSQTFFEQTVENIEAFLAEKPIRLY
ncbi:D-isomer-specific 2-hydroxyacid dehydrogenase NAD-binding protein [Mycena kentingensis (nom. inval.)]|nr:D-isomer-specific 2-hydroxyacid dehydrogenase NAD-binding protein [Mycena kentingensis (nom. inval.)]